MWKGRKDDQIAMDLGYGYGACATGIVWGCPACSQPRAWSSSGPFWLEWLGREAQLGQRVVGSVDHSWMTHDPQQTMQVTEASFDLPQTFDSNLYDAPNATKHLQHPKPPNVASSTSPTLKDTSKAIHVCNYISFGVLNWSFPPLTRPHSALRLRE